MKTLAKYTPIMLMAWLALMPAQVYAAKKVKVKNAHSGLIIKGHLHYYDYGHSYNDYYLSAGLIKTLKSRSGNVLQANEGDTYSLYLWALTKAWTGFDGVSVTMRDGFTTTMDSMEYHAVWKADISVEEKSDHWLIKIKPKKQ